MYHGVSDAPLSPACWHQLDVESFRRQMEWVARRSAVLPLSEALPRLAAGTLPPRACAITFDDGYRNVATNAFPVLARLGLPSTVYLATGTVGTDRVLWPDRVYLAFARTRAPEIDLRTLGRGVVRLADDRDRAEGYRITVGALKLLPAAEKDARLAEVERALGADPRPRPRDFRPLTWDDVARLTATGLVEFGAHTVTHDILSRLPDAEVVRQVMESHATVASRTGATPVSFAYPNGRTIDFDERAKAAVRRARIPWDFATTEVFCVGSSDPLALPRIGVAGHHSSSVFRLHASGALLALRSWRPGNPG
jgi:peptidoglycan/xylan/chitin deacetylase (PgdA/CDA1 family)